VATDRLTSPLRFARERRAALPSLRPRAGDDVERLLPPHPMSAGARSIAATLPISANLLTAAKASERRGALS
jgi:hypothetical protein